MWSTETERQKLVPTSTQDSDPSEERGEMSSSSIVTPVLAVIAVTAIWLAATGFVVVKPGELAVVVTLGHAVVYSPGSHFRTPFVSTVHIMSSKTQLISERNNIPTKEGLSVSLDVALLYRIDPLMAGELFTNVGTGANTRTCLFEESRQVSLSPFSASTDYEKVVIEPEAASVIRGLTSEKDAKVRFRATFRDAFEDI